MKFRFKQWAAGFFLAGFATLAGAADALDAAQEKALRTALEVPGMGITVKTIKASEIDGLYEVELSSGPILYSTATGDYFVAGDLYSVGPDGYVNLAEKRRDVTRLAKMNEVDKKDMIVFSPKGETRGYINVFTDVTCFYCRKLHQEVPALNAKGIEVRYLAYPRAGVGSDGYKKLVTAWCAEKPTETLTRLKADETVAEKSCADNPITAQFALGQEVGVRGTPAIVTQDGRLISGYQPADQLIVNLGLN